MKDGLASKEEGITKRKTSTIILASYRKKVTPFIARKVHSEYFDFDLWRNVFKISPAKSP